MRALHVDGEVVNLNPLLPGTVIPPWNVQRSISGDANSGIIDDEVSHKDLSFGDPFQPINQDMPLKLNFTFTSAVPVIALSGVLLLIGVIVTFWVARADAAERTKLEKEEKKQVRNEEIIDNLLAAAKHHQGHIDLLNAEHQRVLEEVDKSSKEMVALYIKHLEDLKRERDALRVERDKLVGENKREEGLVARLQAVILERKKVEGLLADKEGELEECKQYMMQMQTQFVSDDDQSQQEALNLITEKLMQEHDEQLKAATSKLKTAHQKEVDKLNMRLRRALDESSIKDEEIMRLKGSISSSPPPHSPLPPGI
jgi:hypothetical protein